MLFQYKFLFLCVLEVIQIKTLLCKIPHTCVSAVKILMQMLCTLVHVLHCAASRTLHETVIFHIVQSLMETNQSPSEFCICYEMCCDVEVCDQDIHYYSFAATIPF